MFLVNSHSNLVAVTTGLVELRLPTYVGRGEDQLWGFPSKVPNRLRPLVVMAVRDPLPGLQSNKVTYVDDGQTLA